MADGSCCCIRISESCLPYHGNADGEKESAGPAAFGPPSLHRAGVPQRRERGRVLPSAPDAVSLLRHIRSAAKTGTDIPGSVPDRPEFRSRPVGKVQHAGLLRGVYSGAGLADDPEFRKQLEKQAMKDSVAFDKDIVIQKWIEVFSGESVL